MIVVSNTSPLNYLILLRKDQILPALFGVVIAPPAVVTELSRVESPEIVRSWIEAPPGWFRITSPRTVDVSFGLDAGETEAIALAQELSADRILLDDARARRVATSRGLRVAGTLAVLFEAGERQLIDFPRTLAELRQTTFHVDEKLVDSITTEFLRHKK